jgi:hypothetical protein
MITSTAVPALAPPCRTPEATKVIAPDCRLSGAPKSVGVTGTGWVDGVELVVRTPERVDGPEGMMRGHSVVHGTPFPDIE